MRKNELSEMIALFSHSQQSPQANSFYAIHDH